MSELVRIITAADPAVRNRSLDAFCRNATARQLLAECTALDRFRRQSDNLYERVRALFFLYAIHRFHLPRSLTPGRGYIPFDGYTNLLKRRFEEAIDLFLAAQDPKRGPTDALMSALAAIILTARLNSAQPIAGMMYELDAIAATVIGGTSLMGGEGTLFGTLVGALIMGVLRNGLNLLGVSSFLQQIVIGCVIVGAVLIDTVLKRHRT